MVNNIPKPKLVIDNTKLTDEQIKKVLDMHEGYDHIESLEQKRLQIIELLQRKQILDATIAMAERLTW